MDRDEASVSEQEHGPNAISQLEDRYKAVSEKVKLHLEQRNSDNKSEASLKTRSEARSQASRSSVASKSSAVSKEADINARLKQVQLRQLERRLESERELERNERELEQRQAEAQQRQRELERATRLASARDAAELAAVEAELRKAAEDDLAWNRVDDFAGEGSHVAGSLSLARGSGAPR